jgi:hypothetical protein
VHHPYKRPVFPLKASDFDVTEAALGQALRQARLVWLKAGCPDVFDRKTFESLSAKGTNTREQTRL